MDVPLVDLPDFLDPALNYLFEVLPPPLYSFVVQALSHTLTLGTALITLFGSVFGVNPLEWNAQTILPPLISLLIAYLALSSLYRTTSWFFRMGIFFMKWGTIFGALVAGVGWVMGRSSSFTGQGVVAGIGSLLWDIINGPAQNAVRSQSRTSTRQRINTGKQPKPWNSFKQHKTWRKQKATSQAEGDVQKIVQNILGAADNVLKDNGWWGVAKQFVEDVGNGGAKPDPKAGERTRREKKSNSRSR